jgi:hypothetical protein
MILTTRQQSMLDTLVDHGRERLHQQFRKDCCIAATAVACDCLDWAGFRNVRPFPVQAQVANKAALTYLEVYGEWPETDAQRVEWDAARAHLIGIGFGCPDGHQPGYDGHLLSVADACDGSVLVDLTLDQCDRPRRDLVLPVLIGEVTAERLRSPQMRFDTPAGDAVLYYPRPERDDYRTSPDWTHRQRRDRIVGDLIRTARSKEREHMLT